MNRDNDRTKHFTRRTVLLAGSQGVLLSLLCGRLYWLQVVEAERYTTLADDNRISVRLLAPPRGKLYDRFGRPLAVNRKNFRVVLVAEQSRNVEACSTSSPGSSNSTRVRGGGSSPRCGRSGSSCR